ncbi:MULTISPECIES: hypothetical protein [unclassified Crossiella]|uniref:effector-associated constant component EACC1 n=1 Tax=unclassified Crossiella TaxID=2620835 RepID=UPI001FFF08E0|nr:MULTISPECIES: hypothetical protein [unclassified Crossiella]MCK2245040.1 hypothetical protein [Crossiella sp. S99.2]MCK2258621.1 hypothetical protein [Crossiella sp. S99.1]
MTEAVHISLDGADEDELRRLASWLRDEEELRGQVSLSHQPIRPGEMGGAIDTIVVLVTSGTAAAMVTAVFDWLARRKEAGRVTLRLHAKDGRELEIGCGSAQDLDSVLDQVTKALGSGE